MTKTNLKWRLGKLPTPEEVLKLVNDKLITKEEARDILFNEETEQEVKDSDLKSEIKFLREIIEKLSEKKTIVETIKVIENHYDKYDWYRPYHYWVSPNSITYCGSSSVGGSAGTTNALYSAQNILVGGNGGVGSSGSANYVDVSFSDIKTF